MFRWDMAQKGLSTTELESIVVLLKSKPSHQLSQTLARAHN